MGSVSEALHMVVTWLEVLIGLLLGVFAVIEGSLQSLLARLGVPPGQQQILLLVFAVLIIVAILRVFGGLLRLLLLVFLILLLLHLLAGTVAG